MSHSRFLVYHCFFLVVLLSTELTAQSPPKDGLRLWLDAGASALEDDGIVANWLDEAPFFSGDETPNDTDGVRGQPMLTTFPFPNGDLPVVAFDGDDGFTMDNDFDLFLTEQMSIYSVLVPSAGASQIVIANYVDLCGFGLGISDNLAQEIKWFTANPVDSLETGLVDLEDSVPVLLAATYDSGNKVSYKNGAVLSQSAPGSLDYSCGSQLTVGNLDFGRQFFTGSIAEILVYDTVSESQRTAVESYVDQKYGDFSGAISLSAPSDLSCERPSVDTINLSWTNTHSYDAIAIRRDGQDLVELSPAPESYTDTNVPAGSRQYEVLGVVGPIRAGTSCVTTDFQGDTPPADGLKLWLDAGNGVVADGNAATAWLDQANALVASDRPNNSNQVRGQPLLTTHSFPEGDLPVIAFDGDDGFTMANDSDLYLTEQLSIYTVIVPVAGKSQIVIANYKDLCGFGLGVSDTVAQSAKWFTANPGNSLESGQVDLENSVPVLLAATYDNGNKVSYKNGSALRESTPGTIDYNCVAELTVGNLDFGRQFFTGSIAEILVYDTVSDVQRAEVAQYVLEKYGDFTKLLLPDPPSDLLCERPSADTVNLSWTNADAYDAIEIRRDGQELTVLGPTAESYSDTNVPARFHEYEVLGVIDTLGVGASCSSVDLPANRPPADGLKLWLDAAISAIEAEGSVVACRDLAGELVPSDVPNHSDGVRGEPLLTTHSFSEGDLPVISFDGDDGFTLSNDSDLYLTEQLSIFAVVIPLVGQEQIVISNYKDACGFGLGVSDNMAQELKWFTANPIDSLESEQVDLDDSVPVLLAVTYDNGNKASYRNGVLLAESTPGAIDYGCGAELTVGNLDFGRQFFTGSIAEILVYDTVSDVLRTDVGDYIEEKYGAFDDIFSPPTGLVCERSAENMIQLTWNLNTPYEFIRIVRNDTQIALLAGDATSHTDNTAQLPAGEYTYGVIGLRGDLEAGVTCTVTIEGGPDGTPFRRGDCDQSGKLDFNDAIYHLRFLFLGENETQVDICSDACDADDSGMDDFTDDIHILKVLFLGQGVIPPPGPLEDEAHPCGVDPSDEDETTCETYDPLTVPNVPGVACP